MASDYTVPGYMTAASSALAFVKRALTVGPSNDIWRALDNYVVGNVPAMWCVWKMREATDEQILAKHLHDYQVNQIMEVMAEKAKQFGCGNCSEQAAMAFVYLRNRHIEPLDWMEFTNRDHSFVLLGRPSRANWADRGLWLDKAVICDPYYNRRGPAVEMLADYDLPKSGSRLHFEDGISL